MNNKIFKLQQELIKSQDDLKDAIMSEIDIEKHLFIINKFSKKEAQLSEKLEKEHLDLLDSFKKDKETDNSTKKTKKK